MDGDPEIQVGQIWDIDVNRVYKTGPVLRIVLKIEGQKVIWGRLNTNEETGFDFLIVQKSSIYKYISGPQIYKSRFQMIFEKCDKNRT